MEDPSKMIEAATGAIQGGQWTLAAGAILMFIVWFLTHVVKLRDRVGADAVPWVAAGLGVAGTVALGLSQGLGVAQSLLQGFVSGSTAIGLWELIFKHVQPKKDGHTPSEED